MDPGNLALMIPLAGIGTGALSIYLSHVRKMAEIKAQSNIVEERRSYSGDVYAELMQLREEVRTLRDTSTKFDFAFEAELTRLSERVRRLEL